MTSKKEINELSKKTLGSYIRAAGTDRERKLTQATGISVDGHHMKAAGDHDRAQKNFQKAGELIGKAANRKAGINKAVDRLTKEEAEQVVEVSKYTYTDKKVPQITSRHLLQARIDREEKAKRTAMKAASEKDQKAVSEEEDMWPVYARILEKRSADPHTKGATPPQPHGDNWAGRDKEFSALHGGTDTRKPPYFADDHGLTVQIDDNDDDASTKKIKKSPGRPNDKDVGDKVADKPTDHPEYKSPWPVAKPAK